MILGHDAIKEAMAGGEITHSGAPIKKRVKGGAFAKDFDEWAGKWVEPASIDLEIGDKFAYLPGPPGEMNMGGSVTFRPTATEMVINPMSGPDEYFRFGEFEYNPSTNAKEIVLIPKQRVLVPTKEVIGLGPTLAAQVSTRSSVKRWGLDVCGSAGWVDPGYKSYITLEIYNENTRPIRLTAGMPLAQLIFFRMEVPVEGNFKTYDGHYQGAGAGNWAPQHMAPKALAATK